MKIFAEIDNNVESRVSMNEKLKSLVLSVVFEDEIVVAGASRIRKYSVVIFSPR